MRAQCLALILRTVFLGMAVAWAGPGLAQTATQKEAAPGAQAEPRAQVHQGSGFVLPATLAGARLVRMTDYGAPPTSNPRLGVSYHYAAPGPVFFSVFVYDNGEKPGDGPADPWVQGHFQRAQREMMEVAQTQGRYAGLRLVGEAQACGPAAFRFLCAVYSAHVQQVPYFTAVMLTGWRGNYIKLRADWPAEPRGPGLAETLLEELARAQAGAR